ncbi:MAG: T9SS type A sorting domain-containing protein [Bacteroidetes bacterium]|nr:MAG: T9SS type A sorting domain-containing protein [Bacteroidota bacterium]
MKKLLLRLLFSAILFCIINQNSFSESLEIEFSGVKFEPPDGRVYHGAQLMTYENTPDPLEGYLTKTLNDSTTQPAVRGFFISIPGTRGPEKALKGLADFYHLADSVGFFPELSLFLVSDVATDSIIANSTQYDYIIDSIITLSKNYGKRMFLRIGGEFNGAGPGWNGGGYHPYLYVKMFQKITDMFESRGFRDSVAVIWCYEPDAANDFDSVDGRGARWYPGDEYADWFGLDVFNSEHFDQSLPDYNSRLITRKGKSERFLGMAREKNKPVYMSETSATGINISPDSLDGVNDWNNWFAKFWEFIAVHTEIKGFSYIDANWPTGAYPGWGDARIENNNYVTQKYRGEMHDPRYIHLPFKQKPVEVDTLPLTELGTNKWKNYEGGLYPNGSNERPIQHNSDGIQIANSIVPLNTQGEPDLQGKIVLLSVGMSNCTQEYSTFKQIADADTMKSPKCTIIDGAQGGQTAIIISNPFATFWSNIETRLGIAGLTPEQVQVVWLKEADAQPKDEFPVHAQILYNELKEIVKILKQKYVNIKLCYLSSRTYGGYATTQLNPEPYAYESGFSVKWLLDDQIKGDTALIYLGNNAKSPWLAWGPYLWAKGETQRKDDGLVWLVDDFVPSDRTHPSQSGRQKVANLLLNFLKTDSTAIPWFVKKPPTEVNELVHEKIEFELYPNPATDYLNVITKSEKLKFEIYSAIGIKILETNNKRIDVSNLAEGIYYLKTGDYIIKFLKF